MDDTAESTAIHSASSDHDLRVPCYCEENAWRLVHRHLHGGNPSLQESYEYYVVFVSNESRCIPFFRQRATPDRLGEYVCWDYHVIVIRTLTMKNLDSKTSPSCKKTTKTEVLDMDSWLPYPCPIDIYLDESFSLCAMNKKHYLEYQPLFRVIPARQYLTYFYSDRMHMFKDGKWLSSPPKYQPIMNGLTYAKTNRNETTNHGNVSNLEMYIDMSQSSSSEAREGGDEWGTNDIITGNERNDDTINGRMGTVFTLDEFRSRFSTLVAANDPK